MKHIFARGQKNYLIRHRHFFLPVMVQEPYFSFAIRNEDRLYSSKDKETLKSLPSFQFGVYLAIYIYVYAHIHILPYVLNKYIYTHIWMPVFVHDA